MKSKNHHQATTSSFFIPPHNTPLVCCVILNWNGWRDTIECLESVFKLEYPLFSVIVCDNASSDGSMGKIEDWANGRLGASVESEDLTRLVLPPTPKPVAFDSISASGTTTLHPSPNVRLVLIQTGSNLGFAGGNNVGIRYALAQADCDYIWLLNNDTVVEPDSLSAMIDMAEANPTLGICGSLLRSYAFPHSVLTAGGRRYSPWSGRTRPLQDLSTPSISTTPGAPDYVEGASMLVRCSLLKQVGLLEEGYFLYFEELDLVCRAKPAFHFGYAPSSIVYHKEGASIGSARARSDRSTLSDYYLARNRLVFTRRNYPWFMPSQLAVVAASVLLRILIGKPKNATAILRGAFASFSDAKLEVRHRV